MAEELLILNTNPGHSCRTVVLGFDLRMGSNYTQQMDCESPSNDPEAKSCTHINMAHYSDDIVVVSFPSVNNTQSGPNDITVVHVDDISVMRKYYGCT